jgi:hypothetical protein
MVLEVLFVTRPKLVEMGSWFVVESLGVLDGGEVLVIETVGPRLQGDWLRQRMRPPEATNLKGAFLSWVSGQA